MPIKLVIAVTDKDWFNFLSSREPWPEVNFWAPGESNFRALREGELLLFKLKAPWNKIVGGGVFARSSILPIDIAWETFGTANGVSSLEEMRLRLARLRRTSPDERNFRIGCRIITQPIFLRQDEWLDQPESWSPNTVSFRTYDAQAHDIEGLWEAISGRMTLPARLGFGEEHARFGGPTLITPRLGQGAFRIGVTEAYSRRCAFTGERTLPALDAAHIRPYADGGTHQLSNGLLLRRDLHTLFDQGYITLTPDFRIEVSRRIREEFENGRHYYAMHGTTAAIPTELTARPDQPALRWHNEKRYRG